MAAPVTGLDALATAEEQVQRLMVQMNQREAAMTTPTGVFTTAYDIETQTATFSAAGIPIAIAEAAGVLTITTTPVPTLP